MVASGAAQVPVRTGQDRVERYSVMVVDDDAHVASLHARVVASHPHLVLAGVARSGRSAVAAALRLRPDLVLLDVYLPDLSGVEVLRRLRAAPSSSVDVIAITAARELETVRAAMAGGVLHYLIKPFALPELTIRLDRYVAMRRELAIAQRAGLSQETVDRMLGGGRPGTHPDATGSAAGGPREDTPKGIAGRTLERVRHALAGLGQDASADQVAAQVGVSRVVARRYLEYLVQIGEAVAQPRYGVPGRPETRYKWLAGR